MDKEIKCEECEGVMRRIGPFARAKQESQSADKSGGFFDYECPECGKKVKLNLFIK